MSKERKRLKHAFNLISILRYVSLFAIILILSFLISYDNSSGTFNFELLLTGLFSGALASLIISFINYIYFNSIQKVENEVFKDELTQTLSHASLISRGAQNLTNDEIRNLTSSIARDDRFLESFAELSSENSGHDRQIVQSILKPLWSGKAQRFLQWDNYFEKDESNSKLYYWTCAQKYIISTRTNSIRVYFTDDVQLSSNILSARLDADHIFTVNDIESVDPESCLQISVNFNDGLKSRIKRVSPRQIAVPSHIKKILQPDQLKRIKQFKYELAEISFEGNAYIDMKTRTALSLEEPLFYVIADKFCFVDAITFDYAKINDRFEQVWVQPFVGNAGSHIDHDRELARIVLRVNGPLLPGQGAMLAWKLRNDEK